VHLSRDTGLPIRTVTTELADALSSCGSAQTSRASHRFGHEHVELTHADRWLSRSAPAPRT
jgi:hypothetical protein